MPLHLLGKKSWNVYNADNIARVHADEAAAAAREAANEQRMQELDAERRAAILRGRTPPPLPEPDSDKDSKRQQADRGKDDRGHDRKRRKLAGEDDTDRDIRLATSATAPREDGDENAKILRLRQPASDAPLTDNAGNINLFPVDFKQALKREKNAEAEAEKQRKERALEDQYTMRFSNAAGRGGLEQPWYTTSARPNPQQKDKGDEPGGFSGFETKDVWGNEDPRRKEREQARITSNDPFALMQKAQTQLKKSKEDKKKWAKERDRELQELKATQEMESKKAAHKKRKQRTEYNVDADHHGDQHTASKHRHRRRSKSRSQSLDRSHGRALKRQHEQRRSRDSDHKRERRRDLSDTGEKTSHRHEHRREREEGQISRHRAGQHNDRR